MISGENSPASEEIVSEFLTKVLGGVFEILRKIVGFCRDSYRVSYKDSGEFLLKRVSEENSLVVQLWHSTLKVLTRILKMFSTKSLQFCKVFKENSAERLMQIQEEFADKNSGQFLR